jgi:stearoyl-CoA desaturase (delta-9 desaturase)
MRPRPFSERALAATVITIPLVGTLVAAGLAVRNGIGAVELVALGVMYTVTFFGITVGYHRMLAHRAFRTSEALRGGLLVAGAMAAQGPPLYWVATHRRHHATSDDEGDPHSPNHFRSAWRGFLHSHLLWMVGPDAANISTYCRDLLKDPLVFRIERHYWFWLLAGLWGPALVAGLLTGTAAGALSGFLWGGLVRCFAVHHASWFIGSICHMFGRQPYDTRDRSRNLAWLAPFTFGEAWHNNHHAFPGSAAFGLEWWEVDLPGWTIRGLSRLGLVWSLRIPDAAARQHAKRRGYAATEASSWSNTPTG